MIGDTYNNMFALLYPFAALFFCFFFEFRLDYLVVSVQFSSFSLVCVSRDDLWPPSHLRFRSTFKKLPHLPRPPITYTHTEEQARPFPLVFSDEKAARKMTIRNEMENKTYTHTRLMSYFLPQLCTTYYYYYYTIYLFSCFSVRKRRRMNKKKRENNVVVLFFLSICAAALRFFKKRSVFRCVCASLLRVRLRVVAGGQRK